MTALEGIEYEKYGLNYKPKANMNDHFDVEFEDIQYGSILYNANKFRKINGFSPISE
tara:strand:+ start:340 stop:510 length:171 start_codon:yes stop_codon:yes gene_type:complete